MNRRIFSAAVLLALAGCGGGKTPTYPITGKVTVKGQPAVGALVVFHPKDAGKEKGPKPFGHVKPDGTFELSLNGFGDGGVAGDYGVTVVWNAKSAEAEGKITIGESQGKVVDQLGGRYGNPNDPKLTAAVKKGEANHFVFELE